MRRQKVIKQGFFNEFIRLVKNDMVVKGKW